MLLATVDEAVAHRFDTHAGQLAQSLTPFLSRLSRWHDLAAVQTTAVTVARRRGDPCAEALAHRDLALAHIQLRRYNDGRRHLRHAMARYDQIGDRPGQASTHLHLAWVYDIEGDPRGRCRTPGGRWRCPAAVTTDAARRGAQRARLEPRPAGRAHPGHRVLRTGAGAS
ncbi:hypothetical protein GCM10027614_21990 [Micromonospora vulcania]